MLIMFNSFYPVLFAVPRCVGWLAHWRQQMLTPSGVKIWRPRQLYMGEGERDYVDVQRRLGKADAATPAEVTHGGDSKRNNLATYRDENGAIVKPKL